MNKKNVVWITVLLALCVFALAIIRSQLYLPDYPEDVLYDQVTYRIDPQTILVSLDSGEKNVFLPAPPEPEGAWPILWPSGTFIWDQDAYMKVADALHVYVWKESLEDWHIIRAVFFINQCSDILGRIDSADFSFYQRRDGLNYVHGFHINPMSGNVTAGDQYSYRNGWGEKWKNLDMDKIKINNVDAALRIAEENGGKEIRLSAKNECRLSLLLAPDGLEYNISHPFTHYGWGWNLYYWPNGSNQDPLFSINIDPYTGKYEIK